MPFNLFLLEDLIAVCGARFKRSKIDSDTYRKVIWAKIVEYGTANSLRLMC